MKPRKKQPDVTRRAVLEAAGAEFARHGYSGTGVDAIVSRAELTKGALFHHFPDKRSLAVAWVGKLLEPVIDELWVAPLADLGSLDAMKSFFRTRCTELDAGDATSALVAMAAGTSVTDEILAAAFGRVFAKWRDAIAAMLERGKRDGWIHRSIQPEAEAVFVVSAVAGFCATHRPVFSEAARRGCAAALEAYLETLRAQ